MRKSLLALLLLCLLAAVYLAVPAPEWPGPKANGFLLYNGWRLAPEGIQVPLPDTLPMTAVLDPSGKYLFVLSSGYTQPTVLILDPANPSREGGSLRVGLQNAWLGLAINSTGDRFYVPEANAGTVREFSLSETSPPPHPWPRVRGQSRRRPACSASKKSARSSCLKGWPASGLGEVRDSSGPTS